MSRTAGLYLLASAAFTACADPSASHPAADLSAFPTHAPRILSAPVPLVAAPDAFTLPPSPDAAPRLVPTLPRRAEGPVELRTGAFGIRVRELSASGEGSLAGSAVAYPRAGGTSYWAATSGGMEEWLHLEASATPSGEPAAVWEVEGGALRQRGAAVEIADGEGVVRIRVTAPEGITARGRALEPRLTVEGTRLALWVDAGGEEVLVDPAWDLLPNTIGPHAPSSSVLLPGGDVLVAGGYEPDDRFMERLSTASWSWTQVATPPHGHERPTLTVLPTGDVLVVGAPYGGPGYADVYAPSTNTWTGLVGPIWSVLTWHTATLLGDGRVLILDKDFRGFYDPVAHSLTPFTAGSGRSAHTATLLPDGTVFVLGGSYVPLASNSLLFDPATGWSTKAPPSIPRSAHVAALLHDGRVLVVGGYGTNAQVAELYDPATDSWAMAGTMAHGRLTPTATVLGNGKVLVAGGGDPSYVSPPRDAELFDPATGTWAYAGTMHTGHDLHSATLLLDGSVLIVGGGYAPMGAVERFRFGFPGDTCAVSIDCASGHCVDGFCCDTACAAGVCDTCSKAAGAVANGTCTLLTGTPCDDGDACTVGDACQAGVCAGGAPVVCVAPDGCHDAGVCNPATGVCSAPARADGTACDDGNACTMTDTCQAGVCTGGNPVACPAPAACHEAGACDPASGACSTPASPDGTACDDGDACTAGDACQAGVCASGAPVVCVAEDECHDAGACDPGTGACSAGPVEADGTACAGGSCQAGVCTGSSSSSSSSSSTSSSSSSSTSSSSSGGGTGGVGGVGGTTTTSSSSGGAGGGGGGGASSGTTSTSSTATGPQDSLAFGGCGCRMAGGREDELRPGAIVAALAALGWVRRRRRRGR